MNEEHNNWLLNSIKGREGLYGMRGTGMFNNTRATQVDL